MGRQVVYCDGCGKILVESEFDKGRARTIDNRAYCSDCRPSQISMPAVPGPVATPKPFRNVSSPRLPKPPSTTDTRRVEAPPPKSSAPLVVGGGLAALALVAVVVILATGKPSAPPSDPSAGAGEALRVKEAAPPAPLPKGEEPGAREFAAAKAIQQSRPDDLGGQVQAFQEAGRAAGRGQVSQLVDQEIAAIRRRLSNELSRVEGEAGGALGGEEFQRAISIWETAKPRITWGDWTAAVDAKIAGLRSMARERLGPIVEKALEAKQADRKAELQTLTARVAKWGLPDAAAELRKALDSAVVKPPEPETPRPPKEAEAWKAKRLEALAFAARRDPSAPEKLEAALKTLKDAALLAEANSDLELVKLAAAVPVEGAAAVSKWARGQKASIAYTDDTGARATAEGLVHLVDAHRLELKCGELSVLVPLGELSPATLAEAFLGRAAKRPETDARAAAAFCALEGDLEAAKRFLPTLPARWLEPGKPAAKDEAKEREARELFRQAEWDYFDPSRGGEAVAAYKSLLADHGTAGIVLRNRTAIQARAEAPPGDHVFQPADFKFLGQFRLQRHNRMEQCLMSQADLEKGIDPKAHAVDLEFPAQAGVAYRAWVYVGACCLEVLQFHLQGTELTGPSLKNPKENASSEPGSENWVPVKLGYVSLRKLHSQHTGPKEPDRWEWVELEVPKYAQSGTKTLRLVTNQKGFSIAYACVSATRKGPPREAEIPVLEKARSEIPGYDALRKGGLGRGSGTILREVFAGVGGGTVGGLRASPNFPAKPSSSGMLTSFQAPRDVADDYGQLIRGYVNPPATGSYTFWLAADDRAELWLSTDENAANKVRIAVMPEWGGPDEYGKHGAQKSLPIPLKAGRRYYIEALHAEGGGGDHLSVKWQMPDGKEESPIPGIRLSPWRK
jgi:hypothetical protein